MGELCYWQELIYCGTTWYLKQQSIRIRLKAFLEFMKVRHTTSLQMFYSELKKNYLLVYLVCIITLLQTLWFVDS